MGWDGSKPTTTTRIKNSPMYILNNWDAFEDWTVIEHYGMDNALSGHHQPGQCSVIKVDTTVNISALTDVPCAFAYDTTLNVFEYNDGSNWINIGGPIESGTKMLFY